MSHKILVTLFQSLAFLLVVKGHIHIIKLIVLAIFGLGGLVLYQAVASGSPLSHISSAAGKRSISDWSSISKLGSSPSLSNALKLDEKECARLYICEMASSLQRLSNNKLLPNHLRAKSEEDQVALEEFRAAAAFGDEHKNVNLCRKKYQKCPYTSIRQMERIIGQYQNL